MKLPKFAIENHQFTLVMMALLVLFGLVSFLTMPRSEDPQVQPAGNTIIVIYPGATPNDIEQLIVDPVEEVLNELDDVKVLESSAEDGFAHISVEFQSGSDGDEKYSDVVQKINSIQTQLPENILSMEIIKWTISGVSIFQIALISETASYTQLEREAERLKKQLERTQDVKNVEIFALPEREVRVSVDLEKLAQLRIPLNAVIGAIQDANTNIPGGHVDVGTKRLNIKTSGSYQSLDDIRFTRIHSKGGSPVFLKDIAEVHFDHGDVAYLARVDGRRAIFLSVTQKPGTNIFHIANRIKPKIEAYKAQIPESMALETVFDQSKSVSNRISRFFKNLMQGLLLVGIVIFTAVGWRAAVIVMLAIPISNLIGIGCVDLSGFGLQQLSIAGLVIALGLLVDNAIVVTENISRYMKMGYERKEAAVQGTSEVGYAVISATATTTFAFIPIIMMRDLTGDFIRSMPVTVVFTLTASLLLSLTFTPHMSYRYLKITTSGRERPLRRVLNSFIEKIYRRILSFALEHPKRILLITVVIFLISLALFPLVGVSFFPKAEKPIFFIDITLPEGTNLNKTDDVTRDIEAELRKHPEIMRVVSNVGHGNPQLYYNMFMERQKPYYAQIYVEIKKNDWRGLQRLISELRQTFTFYPGAKIEVKELEQGPPVEAPIAVKLMGENLNNLKQIASRVEAMISSKEGTVNVKNPLGTTKSDLRIRINRAKANMLGVPLTEIDRTVRASMVGLTISQFQDINGNEYNIVVRLPVDEKPTLSDFDRITVSTLSGNLVPLRQLARIELSASPITISHYQMERSVTVTADVERGRSVNNITSRIIRDLEAYAWPKGYHYYIGGEMESREESFGGMTRAIIIAMIAIFGVLVLQFKSYRQPLIVFSAIPLAVIGSILALLITGNSFSFTAFIGLTSLVGIVVNNSIILVDFTNQLRRSGENIVSALKKAGETRFIPIILTTMTTIGGLLPLTLIGGSMWGPMGWTIIGGLLVSTFLTLVIVPVLYRLMIPNSR